MNQLKEIGLYEYFIYPEINWNQKSQMISSIAKNINISTNAIAFIDDQSFERDEVSYALPDVLCIDAIDIDSILNDPLFNSDYITEDTKNRRKMYQDAIVREQVEKEFTGTPDEFLATLDIVLNVSEVMDGDLQRVEELTTRTHQLNSTGYTYSYEELKTLSQSKNHKLLIASLKDKYGSYGKIGIILVECEDDTWTLKLLLVSCRVLSRGIGTILLNYIINEAKMETKKLKAEFVQTDRNRIMYIAYRFAGFKETEKNDQLTVFMHDLSNTPSLPSYIQLYVNDKKFIF
jgi:FkbH-like protein